MPKIVDHEARREEIAQALWRVVRRDGIRSASVRTVAAEAGWSAGAVRYYFPDQDGLISFAMDLVSRRVHDRIAALRVTGSATEMALRYLEEVIPLDPERLAEFDVWLSFIAQAQAETGAGGLREHLAPSTEGLRRLCLSMLSELARDGALRKDLDLDLEAERLHALIDGISLHVAVQPEVTTADRARQVVAAHLDSLQR
ncbi:putative transcriptional regulator, TetR family [Kribbella flavida DSM 17836]|uniref:Putative transcriptional regulator, TetR family n=1 Tax=Kribbella flavida (strain DSM 17836 / JCM 10339 / NBRC 14399) TaxID=479435 RepID=D2PYD8_KRIFD|nr:TetR family transcriptional regulator C-terminal domain-containing protein [Kribbella flavida]ADB35506.1 putative transcriptional regulator, TetR family [Kribbella flavida DSM 17836]